MSESTEDQQEPRFDAKSWWIFISLSIFLCVTVILLIDSDPLPDIAGGTILGFVLGLIEYSFAPQIKKVIGNISQNFSIVNAFHFRTKYDKESKKVPISTKDATINSDTTSPQYALSTGQHIEKKQHVFIGHGRSPLWRELKDFIEEVTELSCLDFNQIPAAGVAHTDRLMKMLEDAAIAFLILTPEDALADGKLQPRMNVVHEVGLCQGRLGFERAIVLVEESCEVFSNIAGLGYIPFQKDNINTASKDIIRVLRRERLLKYRP